MYHLLTACCGSYLARSLEDEAMTVFVRLLAGKCTLRAAFLCILVQRFKHVPLLPFLLCDRMALASYTHLAVVA